LKTNPYKGIAQLYRSWRGARRAIQVLEAFSVLEALSQLLVQVLEALSEPERQLAWSVLLLVQVLEEQSAWPELERPSARSVLEEQSAWSEMQRLSAWSELKRPPASLELEELVLEEESELAMHLELESETAPSSEM
jgi:hypothetical protein